MAARQLAGRRPLYFTADVSIILLTFFFFRRLVSEVSGPVVTKLCHMFGSDCNLFNWVKNLGRPSPKKFGGPKTSKFRISRFDREYLQPGTRYIVDRKTALKTAITPLRVYQIWWTLVHKRRKIGPWIRPTQLTFSDTHISGAKRPCP